MDSKLRRKSKLPFCVGFLITYVFLSTQSLVPSRGRYFLFSLPPSRSAPVTTSSSSLGRIAKLDEDDRQRKRREQARNALESFTNDIGMKLYEELYEQSSTEEEREKLRKAASEVRVAMLLPLSGPPTAMFCYRFIDLL